MARLVLLTYRVRYVEVLAVVTKVATSILD